MHEAVKERRSRLWRKVRHGAKTDGRYSDDRWPSCMGRSTLLFRSRLRSKHFRRESGRKLGEENKARPLAAFSVPSTCGTQCPMEESGSNVGGMRESSSASTFCTFSTRLPAFPSRLSETLPQRHRRLRKQNWILGESALLAVGLRLPPLGQRRLVAPEQSQCVPQKTQPANILV